MILVSLDIGDHKTIAAFFQINLVHLVLTVEQRIDLSLNEACNAVARQRHSVPLLAALRAWLDASLPHVPGKTKLGEALSYLHKYWPKLVRYVERGDLPIDNNRCENAIRPFVAGRKGWLFADTPAGAHASAVIYSLLQTAKANGVEPYQWLCRVPRDLQSASTIEQVETLLPWNINLTRTDSASAVLSGHGCGAQPLTANLTR